LKASIIQLIFFIFCLFVLTSSVRAQERFFNAHVLGGTNFAQVDGDRFAGYNKLGFHGGIGVIHEFDETWKGGFEILYSTKGSKRRIDPEDPNPQIFIISSQYIEFPLIISYALTAVPELSFSGGLSIGVNVGGTVDDGIKREAGFKKSEIAFHLGGAYRFQENISVQLRHSNSLFRVGDVYANGLRIFNRVGLFNRLYMASLIFHL
jgi:Outer membrane protein beta-barrel domain